MATTADDVALEPSPAIDEPALEPAAPALHGDEDAPVLGHDEEDGHHENQDTPDEHQAHDTEAAHDHSAHAPGDVLRETALGRLMIWLGKLHPAAVHFPIAMLLGAALAELISLRSKSQFFRDAARFCLWVGALSAVGAALLGWFYSGFRLIDKESLLTLHRWNGTGVAALAALSLWLYEKRARQQLAPGSAYRAALLLTALMVGANGYLGGLMVYGPEQHQWPEPAHERSQ